MDEAGTSRPSPARRVDGLCALTLETNSFCLHRLADLRQDQAGWLNLAPARLDCSNDSQVHAFSLYAGCAVVLRDAPRSQTEVRPAIAFSRRRACVHRSPARVP